MKAKLIVPRIRVGEAYAEIPAPRPNHTAVLFFDPFDAPNTTSQTPAPYRCYIGKLLKKDETPKWYCIEELFLEEF